MWRLAGYRGLDIFLCGMRSHGRILGVGVTPHLLCGEYNVVKQGSSQEVKREVGAWSREVEEEVRRAERGGDGTIHGD